MANKAHQDSRNRVSGVFIFAHSTDAKRLIAQYQISDSKTKLVGGFNAIHQEFPEYG